jgi:hypothetical protein
MEIISHAATASTFRPWVAGLNGGVHAAAGGELAAHDRPAGPAGAGYVIKNAVHSVFAEDAKDGLTTALNRTVEIPY